MPYKYIEDVAIADTAFEATGKTLTELFQSAAEAVIDSMANPETVKPVKTIKFKKKHKELDRLLFETLEEIVYLKDKDAIVFNSVEIKVDEKKMTANIILTADAIKPEEQELRQDVKAVTMHYFLIQKTDQGWKANIVLDI